MSADVVPDEVVQALVEKAHYIDVANDYYDLAEWRLVITQVIDVLTHAGWTVDPPQDQCTEHPQGCSCDNLAGDCCPACHPTTAGKD